MSGITGDTGSMNASELAKMVLDEVKEGDSPDAIKSAVAQYDKEANAEGTSQSPLTSDIDNIGNSAGTDQYSKAGSEDRIQNDLQNIGQNSDPSTDQSSASSNPLEQLLQKLEGNSGDNSAPPSDNSAPSGNADQNPFSSMISSLVGDIGNRRRRRRVSRFATKTAACRGLADPRAGHRIRPGAWTR